MISTFFRLEWKQYFRSPYWQKSVALNILLVFLALYFIVMFLLLGIGLFPLLKNQFPDTDPFTQVNNYLFYWFLADLVIRFFFQKLPVMTVKPLLILPISKQKIVHYVLGKSLVSFFNFLPLFVVIPFAITLWMNGYGLINVVVWSAFMLLGTLVINFLNFIIENKSAQTELSFLPIILIVATLYAIDYFEIVSLHQAVAYTINTTVDKPILLVFPLLGLLALYAYNFKLIKQQLYIDKSLKVKNKAIQTSEMAWTKKFGTIGPFLQLDLKLIWRNKRSKSTIYLVVIGLLYGLFFYPNPSYQGIPAFFIFVGIFVTGIFMINFGQFIPAWDSSYYKLLMSQNIRYKDYLNSKFVLMIGSAIVLFVLSIPYVYFGWHILLIHFVAMVYNIGVNSHVLLYAGSFNRKSINLDQKAAFNYQGTGVVQWLLGFPLLLMPALLFYLPYKLFGYEVALLSLFIIGLIGIALHQKIMNIICKKYIVSKHIMINAFDQTSNS